MSNQLRALAQQVDERLAELYGGYRVLERDRQQVAATVRRAAGQTRDWRTDTWSGSLADALDATPTGYDEHVHREAVDQYRHIVSRQQHVNVEIAELMDCYTDYYWTRAFLVENTNGHVHKTMDCSTCFPTTEFTWLPQYSGADEDEIVEAAGEDACTVCYPSAPADVLNRPSTIQTATRIAKAAARAEREAAKVERDAKRLAKAATKSGESLIVPDDWDADRVERIDTEYAARREWNDAQDNMDWAAAQQPQRAARYAERQRLIEDALAEKHGITVEEMREQLQTKHAKRRR